MQNLIPKTPRREEIANSLTTVLVMIIFGLDTKNKGNETKNKQVGLYQTTKCLHSKGNYQKNEKATH